MILNIITTCLLYYIFLLFLTILLDGLCTSCQPAMFLCQVMLSLMKTFFPLFLLVHLILLSRFPWKNIILTTYSLKGRSPQLLLPNLCHPPVMAFEIPNILKLFTNCIISRNLNNSTLTLLNLCAIVSKLKSITLNLV